MSRSHASLEFNLIHHPVPLRIRVRYAQKRLRDSQLFPCHPPVAHHKHLKRAAKFSSQRERLEDWNQEGLRRLSPNERLPFRQTRIPPKSLRDVALLPGISFKNPPQSGAYTGHLPQPFSARLPPFYRDQMDLNCK